LIGTSYTPVKIPRECCGEHERAPRGVLKIDGAEVPNNQIRQHRALPVGGGAPSIYSAQKEQTEVGIFVRNGKGGVA